MYPMHMIVYTISRFVYMDVLQLNWYFEIGAQGSYLYNYL